MKHTGITGRGKEVFIIRNTRTTEIQYSYIYYRYRKETIGGETKTVRNRGGYLFDKNLDVTDVRAEDLPPSFIYGIYDNGAGYLDSCGVKGLTYIHNKRGNFINNDVMLVFYSTDKPDIHNYDCFVRGMECISFLRGVNRNSDCDVLPIYNLIVGYQKEYGNEHPYSEVLSYDLHTAIFGFPEDYRRGIYPLDERKARYDYASRHFMFPGRKQGRNQNGGYSGT